MKKPFLSLMTIAVICVSVARCAGTPAPVTSSVPVASPEPAAKCWALPDTNAPSAAQAYKSGVWCESTASHHSICADCGH